MLISERVKQYLNTCDLRRAQLPVVAGALCMSSATLMRRLRAEGTNFRALQDAERKDRCAQLLKTMGRKAYGNRLMQQLGYTELNSFYRAFQRWHGFGYNVARMGREYI